MGPLHRGPEWCVLSAESFTGNGHTHKPDIALASGGGFRTMMRALQHG
jgi:hypothetical protein